MTELLVKSPISAMVQSMKTYYGYYGPGSNGGFHKWGIPNSWRVYEGNLRKDDLGVALFQETSKCQNR